MKRYSPASMPQLFMWCREVITAAGHEFHSRGGEMHCLGVRGLFPNPHRIMVNGHTLPGLTCALDECENLTGRHDDAIIVFGVLDKPVGRLTRGSLVARTFPASVDPGLKYTKKPINARGCAHLDNGQWKFTKGIHKGQPAFVQAAAVKVWRDKNKSGEYEAGEKFEAGWFGINIHASAPHAKDDPYSAGCQVIVGGWKGDHWRRLYALLAGFNRRFPFTYTLVGFDAWAGVVKADA